MPVDPWKIVNKQNEEIKRLRSVIRRLETEDPRAAQTHKKRGKLDDLVKRILFICKRNEINVTTEAGVMELVQDGVSPTTSLRAWIEANPPWPLRKGEEPPEDPGEAPGEML